MSMGLVVIATNTAGLRDIVKHNENGYLVDFGDTPTLSKLLNELLNNQNLCKTLAERARSYISEFFNSNLAIEKYIKIIKQYE
jgi:glycosyltransferase involved in cell wall biosynthesis